MIFTRGTVEITSTFPHLLYLLSTLEAGLELAVPLQFNEHVPLQLVKKHELWQPTHPNIFSVTLLFAKQLYIKLMLLHQHSLHFTHYYAKSIFFCAYNTIIIMQCQYFQRIIFLLFLFLIIYYYCFFYYFII